MQWENDVVFAHQFPCLVARLLRRQALFEPLPDQTFHFVDGPVLCFLQRCLEFPGRFQFLHDPWIMLAQWASAIFGKLGECS